MKFLNNHFEINLGELVLTDKQSDELQARLRETTLSFLDSFDAGSKFLDSTVSYTPHPDDPYPWPYPWPFPWPWPPYHRFRGLRLLGKEMLERQFVNPRKLLRK